jgi:hypothetical protein
MAFGWLKKLPGAVVKVAEKVLVVKQLWEVLFPKKPETKPPPPSADPKKTP